MTDNWSSSKRGKAALARNKVARAAGRSKATNRPADMSSINSRGIGGVGEDYTSFTVDTKTPHLNPVEQIKGQYAGDLGPVTQTVATGKARPVRKGGQRYTASAPKVKRIGAGRGIKPGSAGTGGSKGLVAKQAGVQKLSGKKNYRDTY